MGDILWLCLLVQCGLLALGCNWFREKGIIPFDSVFNLISLEKGEAAACYDRTDCSQCACVSKCKAKYPSCLLVALSSYEVSYEYFFQHFGVDESLLLLRFSKSATVKQAH